MLSISRSLQPQREFNPIKTKFVLSAIL